MTRMFCLPVLALLFACSTPEPLATETGANLSKMAGGATEGTSKSVEVTPAVAASYMGSAHSTNALVKGAEIQNTNTAGAPVQVGWSFAATIGALEKAMADASAASPTMAALKMQLDRLSAATPVDEAAISALIDKIRDEEKGLREALSRGGGDLSGLHTLTQVFTLINTGGADHPISADQAEQLGKTPEAGAAAATIVEKAKE